MNVKEYIQQVYDYSCWANRRYFTVAESLTDEQLHHMQGHSWGDVHAMLVHLMSSEWVWLQHWNGITPKGHLNKDNFPTLASVRERWDTIEAEMRAFIESQTEASLESRITYSRFNGETFTVPLYQILMHVANHETHHRGELAAMFALMNVSHPEEEVMQYFLDLSGQKQS